MNCLVVGLKVTIEIQSVTPLSNNPESPESEEFELLFSYSDKKRRRAKANASVRWYLAVLVAGVIGCVACLWAMFLASQGDDSASNTEGHRISNLADNVLNIVVLSVLMFSSIVSAYALQRLYHLYKSASKPGIHRRR
ncbi:MAG: hypothetical protein AB8B87_25305 [Granulosicoccus sp.]